MAAKEQNCYDFPQGGLQPKDETQTSQFLAKFPDYDGRGVIVAIFDTGVDPGAPGLHRTSDGKVKVIDVCDCSGSGDVEMSTVRKVEKDDSGNFYVKGISERTLYFGKDWDENIKVVTVGIKNAIDLFPRILKTRVLQKKKENVTNAQTSLLFTLREQLADDKALTNLQKKDLKEKINQLEQITLQEEDYFIDCVLYQKPTDEVNEEFNVNNYYAIIDTNQSGLLYEYKPIRDYYLDNEYLTFSSETMLNYAVKIYDKNKLTIVTDAGSHGTHVAGIVAANFPDKPEYNGIAPGAQIVSVKIGDSRLGSMETNNSMIRGLSVVLDRKVDLVNISYGEQYSDLRKSKLLELCESVVNKHGVIIIASAGNEGPCLTTVGAPGGGKSIISVGASVTPSLMEASYSLCEIMPLNQYTWSSRGPTYDGDFGVNITSVGGAISSIPNWTLSGNQLMNGTSMSSPHATGNFALLLSALKAQNKIYTPQRIKRAIENSAKRIDGLELQAQGCGLIQILSAYQYCLDFFDLFDENYEFGITVLNNMNGIDMHTTQRGIYLREIYQVQNSTTHVISVSPFLPEIVLKTLSVDSNDNIQNILSDNLINNEQKLKEILNIKKIGLSLQLKLVCKDDWVVHPSSLLLMNEGRQFSVTINPMSLAPGLHTSEILAFDTSHPNRGPLFRVPITVVKPNIPSIDHSIVLVPSPDSSPHPSLPSPVHPPHVYHFTYNRQIITKEKLLTPAAVDRNFLHIPIGATWLELTMELKSKLQIYSNRTFMVESRQLLPQISSRDCSFGEFFKISEPTKYIYNIPLFSDNQTIEVTIAQFWSSLGETPLTIHFHFKGIQTIPHAFPTSLSAFAATSASRGALFNSSNLVELSTSNPHSQIQLFSPLSLVSIKPTANLDAVMRTIFPDSSTLQPLVGQLNQIPKIQHYPYQLILEYKFTVREANLEVKPTLPRISHLLYESDFQAQFYMIFDENKRIYGKGDVWPTYAKLGPAGTYVLRYQLCHHSQKTLTDLQTVPVNLYIRLPNAIPLTVHTSYNSASGASAFDLPHGRRCTLFVNATNVASKLSSDSSVENNDVLFGSISFSPVPIPSPSSSTNLQYSVSYIHNAKPSAPSASSSSASSSGSIEEKIAAERLSSNIRLMEIYLADLKNKENFEKFQSFYNELDVDNFPLKDKLRVFETFLTSVDSFLEKASAGDSDRLADIFQFVNYIQGSINKNELASELLLCKSFDDDEEDKNYSENAKLVEKKKSIWVSLLFVTLRIAVINLNNGEASGKEKISENLKEIRKWVGDDAFNQPKYLHLQAQYEYHSNLFGLALKSIASCLSAKTISTDLRKSLNTLRLEIYKKLEWDFIVEYQRNVLFTHFPPSYPLFNH